MTKFKALGTACLVAALAATTPALAAGFNMGGARGVGNFHAANARFVGGGFRGGNFHHGGFGPGIAAGVIAGTALGAAATGGYGYYDAPYAYDDGYPAYDGDYGCQPGTYVVGADGRRYRCQ